MIEKMSPVKKNSKEKISNKEKEKRLELLKDIRDTKKESILGQTSLKLDVLKEEVLYTKKEDGKYEENNISSKEEKIKENYGDDIGQLIEKYCKGSIIDENLLYGIIAKESKFNEKAISKSGVKGLCQITGNTVKHILISNKKKKKEIPKSEDLYITKLNRKESLKPLNQIKLAISYLLELESLFNNISNKDFKKALILTSYNLGPGKTKSILNKYRKKGINDWEGLQIALKQETKRGGISKRKYREVIAYVNSTKDYKEIS